MLMKTADLTGYSLLSRDGEIGKVKDFYFDDHHWAARYLVADTGPWLTERCVLLSPYALLSINQDDKQISVDLSKKQIVDSPSLNTDKPISLQFEESYNQFYGWPQYWSGSYVWGNYPTIIRNSEQRKAINEGGKEWNPHLRSAAAVRGYHIQATDGMIGHVEDYVIDDDTWEIRYMIIDTRNWLPGRKVLISPKWIEKIRWDESKVYVNLCRDAIKDSPQYSEEALISREYEALLYGHYNHEGYWQKH
jgi:sporulation protein YlmC with PRC-barrel domain